MNQSYLEPFFNCQGVALIGASTNPNKWGFRILANIVAGGFKGPICPINPKGGTLFGLKIYPSLKLIPDSVDLAVITIPAGQVPQALEECAEKGIQSIIVISSGFSETGPEGRILEDKISRMAQEKGLHFVGPNTMGVFSAKTKLHALMPPVQPLSGGVSYVSQSGNVGVQMLSWGMERGVGFSKFISSGTEGDLQIEDYIDYFSSDPDTKVILAYIEGLKDGRRFLDTAQKAAQIKPVILFKGGKTDVGSKAAQSHSGALAGRYTLFKAACQQIGLIEAETTDSLLDYAAAFLHYPLPRGKRIAILTRGGGWGVVAADACREWGLELPPLPDRLIEKLNQVLPAYWSHGNPIDMAATLNPEALPRCLEALIQEEWVDGIIAQGVDARQRSLLMAEKLQKMQKADLPEELNLEKNSEESPEIKMILELMTTHKKPVVMVSGLSSITRSIVCNGQETVIFPTPERGVRAMAKLCQYGAYLQRS
jgi:acyl-CoA synthetase (NDP forming)